MGLRNIDDEGSGGAVDVDALNAAIASAQATADSALQVASITAADLGDVSLTAGAALSNAQAASDMAGLAATQVDFNALADDLANPLRPRVYRWISNVITEADIPPAPGSDCEFALVGATALPGSFIPIGSYILNPTVATSTDPATTMLLARINTVPYNFTTLTNGVDLFTATGRVTGDTGAQLGSAVNSDLGLHLDTSGGDLAHVQDLSIRVVIDYTLPGEPS